jgi:hypothetical protein
MKIKQRQDVEVKFKLKGKIITGVVEVRSPELEYNIKNNEYRTMPVRVGNIIYVVSKEMVIEIINTDKINLEEKKIKEEKEYEKKMCKKINDFLNIHKIEDFTNKKLEYVLRKCINKDILISLAKKFRNAGRLKLRRKN